MRWRKDRDEGKERDILIERPIMGLARNLALEKFPGIHKDDPILDSLQTESAYLFFPQSQCHLLVVIL